MAEQLLETPLRFTVKPGTVAAQGGHTVVILELLGGSRVRVRHVATGTEHDVSVSELSGISSSLTPAQIKERREVVRHGPRRSGG